MSPRKPPKGPHKSVWKPGQSGNPNGRPRSGTMEFRRLNQEGLEKLINEMLEMTDGQLEDVLTDPDISSKNKLIARIILEGIERGCTFRFSTLMDRLVGKVKEKVEIEMPKPTIIERLDGSTVELGVEQKDEKDE